MQRVEALELECHQLREDALPHQSNTGSNSRHTLESSSKGQVEVLEDMDIAFMEIAGQEPNPGEMKATPDNESKV